MIQVPPLSDFYAAADAKRISMDTDPTGRLVCFHYTEATAANADWDRVTLNARGIVFEKATGDIVARPFSKFFNYNELYADTELAKKCRMALIDAGLPAAPAGQMVRVMDKIDGSLGIAYFYDGEWCVNTVGSFTSPQAKFATDWLRERLKLARGKSPISMVLNPTYTHLFEITWSKDKHPIKYERDELVLLSIIDKVTGRELLANILEDEIASYILGSRRPDVFNVQTLGEIADECRVLPCTKEGFVITWANGFKLKMKGDAYLKLLAVYEHCTDIMIWRSYDPTLDIFHAHMDETANYKYLDDEPLEVPEELPEIREYLAAYRNKFSEALDTVIATGDFIKMTISDPKSRVQYIHEHYEEKFWAPLLAYVNPKMNMNAVKRIVNKCVMRPEPNANDELKKIFGYKD